MTFDGIHVENVIQGDEEGKGLCAAQATSTANARKRRRNRTQYRPREEGEETPPKYEIPRGGGNLTKKKEGYSGEISTFNGRPSQKRNEEMHSFFPKKKTISSLQGQRTNKRSKKDRKKRTRSTWGSPTSTDRDAWRRKD